MLQSFYQATNNQTQMMLMYFNWLMSAEPWVQYLTHRDLLRLGEDDPTVVASRAAMKAQPTIQSLLAELQCWPGAPVTGHKSAGLLIHKLAFVAELGFTKDDPEIRPIIDKILVLQSPEGPFQILLNIPAHFGGSGAEQAAWTLTNTPTVLYALAKFGLCDDPRVQKAAKHLVELCTDNGWRCVVSPELGKFRGPGRKDDPYPYATLMMLRAISAMPAYANSPPAHIGVETLLNLWQQRRALHPYMFYMGTDFCKIKLPFVWYDLMAVLEVITRFPHALADPRLREMAQVLRKKADAEGRFMPESVWQAWAGWDFVQKKTPSPGLTFFATRILNRLDRLG